MWLLYCSVGTHGVIVLLLLVWNQIDDSCVIHQPFWDIINDLVMQIVSATFCFLKEPELYLFINNFWTDMVSLKRWVCTTPLLKMWWIIKDTDLRFDKLTLFSVLNLHRKWTFSNPWLWNFWTSTNTSTTHNCQFGP